MTILRLAWASLRNRRGAALLTIISIALSVSLLLGVEKLRRDARDGFASTISGTDLIVGARGGAVQLLLYSVFRIGQATNNISWASYQQIAAQPGVAWTVPISLGDSHRGYRVMGTSEAYFEHYRYAHRQALQFAQGRAFAGAADVVLGATVARELGYEPGQSIRRTRHQSAFGPPLYGRGHPAPHGDAGRPNPAREPGWHGSHA